MRDEKATIEDWEWYGFWRAVDEILRRLPLDRGEARRELCRQANEWAQETALAALVLVLAPLESMAHDRLFDVPDPPNSPPKRRR